MVYIRSQNRKLVNSGTGTVKNSYGSATLTEYILGNNIFHLCNYMNRKKGRIPGLAVPEEGYPAHSRGRWGGSAASHHTQGYSSGPCTDTL
jgi:hypothetical protein